jgi:hypothetical protein
MTSPEPLPDEVELIALAELAKRVKERQATTKAVVGAAYADGDKHTFRSPIDGRKLGQVWRTDPDAQWRIVDEAALLAHLRTFPECVETFYEIADEQQAVAFLRVHAPHLLVEVERVIPQVITDAVTQSRETGEPAAPGIDLVKAPGVLTVKPDPAAGAVIERLQQAGWLGWDGRPTLPPATEQAS